MTSPTAQAIPRSCGLGSCRFPAHDWQAITVRNSGKLLGTGMSLAQIARRIGVSVGTVHRVKQIMIVNGNADPTVQQAA
jgi:hypothetical protein